MADIHAWGVGSMCHCDDPDDCFDHWQLFMDPKWSEWADPEERRVRSAIDPKRADYEALLRGEFTVAKPEVAALLEQEGKRDG